MAQALLLFLFLYLLPPPGLSYPLGFSDLASDLPKMQKLLDTRERQAERMAVDSHEQDRVPVRAQKTMKTTSTNVLWESLKTTPTNVLRKSLKTTPTNGIQTSALKPVRVAQTRNKKPTPGSCFGRKMERINLQSGLGCNGESSP
ncbi:PREDICTED: natriuretic peptides B [Elephantulus edwardii]|uniref:natriuretic peptides B n=1 Tax=Elephantulus edwardii TaxID=28737 RepID=UPI0003F0B347|nr:PREDICTED: natriuretic peptides B [Elephantulus edwardii]